MPTRRRTLAMVGALATGGIANTPTATAQQDSDTMSSYDPDKPGNNFIHLGNEGLSDGDDLTPYVDTYFSSGNQVYIPPGSNYFFDASALSGSVQNASLWGDPAGVEVQRPDPTERIEFTINVEGDILIENMTLWGEKSELQSDWRIDTEPGTTAYMTNLNWPDGTVSPSDSQIFYSEGSGGTLHATNIYGDGFANSSYYLTYSDVELILDGCVHANSNTTVRPGVEGATVRNCAFYEDGFVPQFSQDGGPAEGAGARFFRTDVDCEIQIENLHAWIMEECNATGPVLHGRGENLTGHIDGFYLYNETGEEPVAEFSGLSGENIHTSGPGDLNVPWSVDGSQSPSIPKQIWKPEGSGGTVEDYDLDPSPDSQPQGGVLEFDADGGTNAGDVDYSFTADPN